jgi:hypothetical protein
MELTKIFIAVAAIGVVVYIVVSLMIYNELKKRNAHVHFIFLKFMIPFYANRYKSLTTAETGKPGALFYYWVISINTALIFAIAAIVSK